MLTQEQKDFYDAMNDGVYIVDRNRKILYWNKAAEEIAGFTAEEVIGKSCA
ncbi:MAG TPA: PAS domain-containing protein, partial [Candidatus Hydrogenedentes bacterium]|nr:PAS domain-containing protein [Candidatus Hydrogenedentota bacterium]